ncbi:MAG: hypothetical protein IKQ50_01210 [Paludibacteraceae bacterium]|nr:hypothetical protein [Paludibacteraceae bacterium]
MPLLVAVPSAASCQYQVSPLAALPAAVKVIEPEVNSPFDIFPGAVAAQVEAYETFMLVIQGVVEAPNTTSSFLSSFIVTPRKMRTILVPEGIVIAPELGVELSPFL